MSEFVNLELQPGFIPTYEKIIEAKNNLIHVPKEDKLDPIVNVALGIRLLGHKYSQIPKGYSKDSKGMITGYNSFNEDGKAYANKVLSLYEKALKNK